MGADSDIPISLH